MAIRVQDSFTEVSPPVELSLHSPDVGGAWAGTGAFLSVVAGNVVQGESGSRYYINAGVADAAVSVVVTVSAADGGNSGIIVNWVDSSNHWVVFIGASGTTLYEMIEGLYYERATNGAKWANGDVATILCTTSGDSMAIATTSVSGPSHPKTDTINYSPEGRNYQTATYHGLYVQSASTTLDDFLVEGEAPILGNSRRIRLLGGVGNFL